MKENLIVLPDEQVGFMLSQTYLLKQRIIGGALKELNITYIQFVILATILELRGEKGWITQQTIASKRRLDKVTVSNVVKTLVQKGLVKRNHHPEDHRALVLRLTTKGVDMAVKAKVIVWNTDEKFFSVIDSDRFREALRKLLDGNIDHTEDHA